MKMCMSWRIWGAGLLLSGLLGASLQVQAAGTPVGTVISNQATVNYAVNGLPLSASSNTVDITVQELIEFTLTWQDAANITVAGGDTDRVLTFLLTNTGNGTEAFSLSVNNALAGDQFDPVLATVYLDANGNGVYDAGTDTLYTGANHPDLAADASVAIFVLNNMPATLSDGDLGNSALTVTSTTGSGAAGTVVAGGGDAGVDALIGNSLGQQAVTGTYEAAVVTVSVVKSVTISDTFGGSTPVPGATLSYSLVVTVTGTGTAQTLVITDPVPTNTTYVANSLQLNGSALSDAADADAGDVGATTAGTVTVDLGDVVAGSAASTVSFSVTIDN